MGLSLDQHRAAIIATLKALMPDRVKADGHRGRFDLAELDRYAASAPCIRLALLEFQDRDGSLPGGTARFEAYIITKDGRDHTADEYNLVLGSLLVAICKGQLLCSDDASSPGKPRYLNLYNSASGDRGLVLGSVSWTQQLELAMAASPSQPEDFLTLHADFDFTPADGVIDGAQDINLRL